MSNLFQFISLKRSGLYSLRLAQISLLSVFVALTVTYSLTTPLTKGPDALAHFWLSRFIAQHGRLPITWEEREEAGYKSDWPPLFHVIVGLIGRGIDLNSPPFIRFNQGKQLEYFPRTQLAFGNHNLDVAWALPTEDPLQGELLFWYLGRWVTIGTAVIGVIATYWLIRTVYPDNPWLAVSSTGLLIFIPTYTRISGFTSYEPLLAALLAVYFIQLFYVLKRPAQNWGYFSLGLLMGLACLTKYTPLPAVPILLLLVIWFGYKQRWEWLTTFSRLTLVMVGLALTFGIWVLYMIVYFNQIAELGWINGLVNTFFVGNNIDNTSLRLAAIFTGGDLGKSGLPSDGDSFFDWVRVFLIRSLGPSWLLWTMLVLFGVALIGLIRRWPHDSRRMRLWTVLLGAHIVLFSLLPFMRFWLTRQSYTASGQHILFPAGAVAMLLLIRGVTVWLPPGYLTGLFLLIVGVSIPYSTTVALSYALSPLPVQTVPLTQPEIVLASLDKLSLIDYKVTADDKILQTTLYWRAEALVDEDYRLELTIVDEAGQAQARWVGQPVDGKYPTRAWAPGDRVRDTVHIPIAGLLSGDYQVKVRLLGQNGPVFPAAGTKSALPLPIVVEGDSLTLERITLHPTTAQATGVLHLRDQAIGYTLWRQGVVATEMPSYGENSTIVLSTQERLDAETDLSLVGPDGQSHDPIDHTGLLYIFFVEPHFANGAYSLRIEQATTSGRMAQAETAALLQIKTEDRQFEAGPISHPVQANFAGQVALLGYDLPQRQIQAGSSLPITLHWQALKTLPVDLINFNNLVDDQGKSWGGVDRRPRDVYSTILWASGEVVADPFNLHIDANIPDGVYYLLVGFYLPYDQSTVALPLMENNQLIDRTNVRIGPIKIGDTPPGFTIATANPHVELNQPFGDPPALTLLGYDLTDDTNHAIADFQSPIVRLSAHDEVSNLQSLMLTLYWRSESILPIDYTTFVHVRNEDGETVAQKDQPPLSGAYPTSLWEPGELIADEIIVPLPPGLPDGEYQIVIGLYDFQTGQRLNIPDNPANEIRLTGVKTS